MEEERTVTVDERVALQDILIEKEEVPNMVCWVKVDLKKKPQPRILIVGKHRMLLCVPQRVEVDIHYYQLESLTCANANEVEIGFKGSSVKFISKHAQQIVKEIRTAYSSITVNYKEEEQFNVIVSKDILLPMDEIEYSLFDGHILAYEAWSNYFATMPNSKYEKFVKKLHDAKSSVMDLTHPLLKNHIAPGDFPAILKTLVHDGLFSKVILSGLPVGSPNLMGTIGEMVGKNDNLEYLAINGILGPKDPFQTNIGPGMLNLKHLDVSNNLIDDRGILCLGKFFKNPEKGLEMINIRGCGLTAKNALVFINSILRNPKFFETLKMLDISNNTFSGEASRQLGSMLTNLMSIEEVIMSNTQISAHEVLMQLPAISQTITKLDISQNKLTDQACFLLSQFISSASMLAEVSLAYTDIPTSSLVQVLQQIGANQFVRVDLNISGNDIGAKGMEKLKPALSGLMSLRGLSCSDNKLEDEGICHLAEALTNNPDGIESLRISYNKRKFQNGDKCIEKLVALLKSSTPLQELSICGNKQMAHKQELLPLLASLMGNSRIHLLDISGNMVGDSGAVIMSEYLRRNLSLSTLLIHDNNFSIRGLKALAVGMESNTHLLKMSPLTDDVQRALKSSMGKSEDFETTIAEKLEINKKLAAGELEALAKWELGSKNFPPSLTISKWLQVLRDNKGLDPKLKKQLANSTQKLSNSVRQMNELTNAFAENEQLNDAMLSKIDSMAGKIADSLEGTYKKMFVQLKKFSSAFLEGKDEKLLFPRALTKPMIVKELQELIEDSHRDNQAKLHHKFTKRVELYHQIMVTKFQELLEGAPSDVQSIYSVWLRDSQLAMTEAADSREEEKERRIKLKETKDQEKREKKAKDEKEKRDREKQKEKERKQKERDRDLHRRDKERAKKLKNVDDDDYLTRLELFEEEDSVKRKQEGQEKPELTHVTASRPTQRKRRPPSKKSKPPPPVIGEVSTSKSASKPQKASKGKSKKKSKEKSAPVKKAEPAATKPKQIEKKSEPEPKPEPESESKSEKEEDEPEEESEEEQAESKSDSEKEVSEEEKEAESGEEEEEDVTAEQKVEPSVKEPEEKKPKVEKEVSDVEEQVQEGKEEELEEPEEESAEEEEPEEESSEEESSEEESSEEESSEEESESEAESDVEVEVEPEDLPQTIEEPEHLQTIPKKKIVKKKIVKRKKVKKIAKRVSLESGEGEEEEEPLKQVAPKPIHKVKAMPQVDPTTVQLRKMTKDSPKKKVVAKEEEEKEEEEESSKKGKKEKKGKKKDKKDKKKTKEEKRESKRKEKKENGKTKGKGKKKGKKDSTEEKEEPKEEEPKQESAKKAPAKKVKKIVKKKKRVRVTPDATPKESPKKKMGKKHKTSVSSAGLVSEKKHEETTPDSSKETPKKKMGKKHKASVSSTSQDSEKKHEETTPDSSKESPKKKMGKKHKASVSSTSQDSEKKHEETTPNSSKESPKKKMGKKHKASVSSTSQDSEKKHEETPPDSSKEKVKKVAKIKPPPLKLKITK